MSRRVLFEQCVFVPWVCVTCDKNKCSIGPTAREALENVYVQIACKAHEKVFKYNSRVKRATVFWICIVKLPPPPPPPLPRGPGLWGGAE